MTLSKVIFIFLTVVLLSLGQILFKIAAVSFNEYGFFNYRVFVAISVYVCATVMWFLVLKTTPLSLAYPFVGLAFVLVPILSTLIFREAFYLNNLIGALLIVLGVWVSVS